MNTNTNIDIDTDTDTLSKAASSSSPNANLSNHKQVSDSTQAYEIKEKLAELEAALLEGTPNMPSLLRIIHSTLKKDSDLVTLLSEEECSILVQGLKKQTSTEIATSALKKPKKAMGKMQIGLDL